MVEDCCATYGVECDKRKRRVLVRGEANMLTSFQDQTMSRLGLEPGIEALYTPVCCGTEYATASKYRNKGMAGLLGPYELLPRTAKDEVPTGLAW